MKKLQFKIKIILLLTIFPLLTFANVNNNEIWQATYYDAIPNHQGISQVYCEQHVPGTFVGTVDEQLAHGTMTNRNIQLSHLTFHVKLINGIYFMQGNFIAEGKTAGKHWQDPIHYYVYKLTEQGITHGVWSSRECKGFYVGRVINNKH